jgi:putative hydrolase of the HAD superfamily
MKPPKGILFDLGDTVLIERGYYLENGVAELLRIAQIHNRDFEVAHEKWLSALKDFQWNQRDGLLEFSFRSFLKIFFEHHQNPQQLPLEEIELLCWKAIGDLAPASGIKKIFATLEEMKIPCGVVSNAIFGESILRWELRKHGLESAFHFVISSGDYGIKKPHPLLFQIAIAKLGVKPEETWFVGDSIENDIVGAKNAGLVPIWISQKAGTHTAVARRFCTLGELTFH